VALLGAEGGEEEAPRPVPHFSGGARSVTACNERGCLACWVPHQVRLVASEDGSPPEAEAMVLKFPTDEALVVYNTRGLDTRNMIEQAQSRTQTVFLFLGNKPSLSLSSRRRACHGCAAGPSCRRAQGGRQC